MPLPATTPKARALLFLLPALSMGALLVHDLARPSRTLARYARPEGPAGDPWDLPARAGDWAGPLSRLRGWAAAAGVDRVGLLLAILAFALLVAIAASVWSFWRGHSGATRQIR